MNYKKVISLGIALSMVLGTNVSAFTVGADVLGNSNEAVSKEELLKRFTSGVSQEIEKAAENKTKDSDTVRVIVEMEGENVLAKATQKGIQMTEMSSKEVAVLQKTALAAQDKVMKQMDKQGIDYDVLEKFTNVFNGFSAETTFGEAKKIEQIKGVKSVSVANEYERPEEPDMVGSNDITDAEEAWNMNNGNGYDGEGTVVAVLDSGMEISHKDFILSDDTQPKLDEEEVNALVAEHNLPGKFFKDKVPYGYNYMDENYELRDLAPDAINHGMHVAGIVAANGDTENGGIKGTAPEAQVLVMKVFGNNPTMSSTFSDILIKAMDDAVELGADVINMSLGAPAGFVDDADPEQIAVNNAAANGVVVSCAAGNDYKLGDDLQNPYASNPDYGVVGSPATSREAFAVASAENKSAGVVALEYVNKDGETVKVAYKAGGDVVLQDVFSGKKINMVDCGLGNPDEIQDGVSGKIAIIKRGDLTFVEKINNAAAKGAVGVIIYNHEEGGNELVNMDVTDTTIPSCAIGHDDGLALLEAVKANPEITVEFNGKETDGIDPKVMSDFSSWGVTPDLGLKPDITGIGGNVKSLAPDNGYQDMGGTSMATPNISGASAVVYEMMSRNDKFNSLKGIEKVNMAKNLLMSTAVPYTSADLFISPRKQGAGIVNIFDAVSTPAIVKDANTGVSKVNLKEINGDTAVFTVTVQNFTDQDISYEVSGTVQSDLNEIQIGQFYDEINYSLAAPQAILKGDRMPIAFNAANNKIEVPANGSKDVTVTIDLAYAKLANGMTLKEAFKNGAYVEGFVVFDDVKDTNPQISIPYMGFYGDWNAAPAIDYSRYEKDQQSFYDQTFMHDGYYYLGQHPDLTTFDGDFIDISPNDDELSDFAEPRLSYLRNIKEIDFQILDNEYNQNVLRTIYSKQNVRKHYQYAYWFWLNCIDDVEDAAWDGTIDGKPAEEGTYIYRIRTKIEYPGAEYQYKDFKINVDLTGPTIENIHFDPETYMLKVVAEDNFKGHVKYYRLLTPEDYNEDGFIDSVDGNFNLTDLYDSGYALEDCTLGVVDYAKNVSRIVDFSEPQGATDGDTEAPVVEISEPEYYAILSGNEVTIKGFVTDESKLAELTINGDPVDFTWTVDDSGWSVVYGWSFEYTTTFPDGYNNAYIYTKDAAGNEIGFSHRFFVDSKAPVVELDEIEPVTTKDTVKITGLVTENSPSLKVTLNGNQLYNVDPGWEAYDYYDPASYEIDYDYKLSNGENTITIEASDLSGHITSKTLTINKVDSIGVNTDKVIGEDRYDTAAQISKKGWTQSNYAVIANGEAYIDSLVASPLAASYNAPILLTETDELTADTAKELQRLGVKTVFLAGGRDVISQSVETAITDLGIGTVRFGGNDRYETSKLIAMYIDRQQAINEVYVVGGEAVADAVTVSSKAAMDKTPIILVENDEVPADIAEWLTDEKIEKATVVGGPDVVSDAVLAALDEITTTEIPTARIYGEDRYDTNAAVIDALFPTVVDSVFVTDSEVFIDALVAAPYAAQKGAPVVIAGESLSEEQAKVMDKMLSYEVVQVGGRVSAEVVEDMAARLSIEK